MEPHEEVINELQNKTKKVIAVSIVVAFFVVICTILSYTSDSGDLYGVYAPSILSIIIPICGILGARNKNPNLLSWFTWCSLCEFVCGILYGVGWIITASILSFLKEHCDDDDKYNHNDNDRCKFLNSSSFWVYFAIAVVMSIIISVLSFLSYHWGKELYSNPYFNHVIINPPVYMAGQGPIEMVQYVTPSGQIIVAPYQQQPLQQMTLSPQQPSNIVQGIPAYTNQQGTYVINMDQQPQIQQSQGTYVSNINQPPLPQLYQSPSSDSSIVLLQPPNGNNSSK